MPCLAALSSSIPASAVDLIVVISLYLAPLMIELCSFLLSLSLSFACVTGKFRWSVEAIVGEGSYQSWVRVD